MLCLEHLVTMKCQNIKNSGLKISIFELPRVENCMSRLCPSPLPLYKHPNRVKTHEEGLKHALHRMFDHGEW